MASLRGSQKTAIALFVDGLEVKLARLSLRKGRVALDELRSATLVTKLEDRQVAEVGEEEVAANIDEFTAAAPEALPESTGSEDNNAVLLGLLSPYKPTEYVLSYSIAEPSLYYHTMESPQGLKGAKLKKRIIEDLQTTRSAASPIDAIDHITTAEGGLMAVVREDGVSLYSAIEGIKPFIGNRLPRFTLMESADIALMGLARANYGFAPEEISVIIYVGVEFSRLIFMKGAEFFHFAPVIGEGYEAPNIPNTIYARLLLEQDGLGIPRVDRILVAGEGRRVDFEEFLKAQLPEVDIQYLRAPYVDTSQLPAEVQDKIPEYAVPIATAWKVLQQSHPAFYPTNLLPESILEGQKVFKLAWHGLVLMGLIFVSTFFFTAQITTVREQISSRETELERKQTQVKVNDELRSTIDSLNRQLAGFDVALEVYNKMVPGFDRWSGVATKIDSGFQALSGIWLTEVDAKENGVMTLSGFTLYRSRIPMLVKLFDNSVLKTVEVEEIRTKTVYRFIIEVSLPKLEKK